jgi:hypothetical protein
MTTIAATCPWMLILLRLLKRSLHFHRINQKCHRIKLLPPGLLRLSGITVRIEKGACAFTSSQAPPPKTDLILDLIFFSCFRPNLFHSMGLACAFACSITSASVFALTQNASAMPISLQWNSLYSSFAMEYYYNIHS